MGKKKNEGYSGGALFDPRHEKFALAIAEGKTLEDAHKEAGYVPDRANASKLNNRPEVRARVRYLQEEAARAANIRRARLVVDIDNIAQANIADFLDIKKVSKTGKVTATVKDISKLPRELTAAIQRIKINPETGEQEIVLKDSLAAQQILLKYVGGLPEPPVTVNNFNIFDVLPADDQRALADALEAAARRNEAADQPASGERGEN